MRKRPYTQRRRAESQDETRARILEAIMALHEEIGPYATTISAIAERAGVQRLTVYRHFPDEPTLIQACTSTWIERHPPPAPSTWHDASTPHERVRTALIALFTYYRRTNAMWTAAHRDEPLVPALAGPMQAFRDYLTSVVHDLSSGYPDDHATAARIHTLSCAVAFSTWTVLSTRRLSPASAARLVVTWLHGCDHLRHDD